MLKKDQRSSWGLTSGWSEQAESEGQGAVVIALLNMEGMPQ